MKNLLTIVSLIFLTSCSSYYYNSTDRFEPSGIIAEQKKPTSMTELPLHLDLATECGVVVKHGVYNANCTKQKAYDLVKDVFDEFGYAVKIAEKGASAPTLKIDYNDKNPVHTLNSFFSFFTLGIIPVYSGERFTMELTNSNKTVKTEDGQNSLYGLLLFPVENVGEYRFNKGLIKKNMLRDLIKKAKADNVI